MPGITDLDITYGDALAPSGFHKITLADGGQAALNRGVVGAPCFLWYHENEGRGDPISDIKIVHSAEEIPPGFTKLAWNILKGQANQVAYLCYKRDKDVDPISNIRILYGNELPGVGFEKLSTSITISGDPIYLCFERTSKDTPLKWSAFSLTVGDYCDAKDTANNWCIAQVLQADENTVTLHYKGWGSKWDEVVSRTSPKLSELGSQTSGKDTGWVQKQQGSLFELHIDQIKDMKTRLINSMKENETVAEQLWSGDLPCFVERVLSSTFNDPNVVPVVNDFLRELISVLANRLVNDDMSPGKLQMLSRALGYSRACTWYYDNYGCGGNNNEDSALTLEDFLLDGNFLKYPRNMIRGQEISKLYITNMNHFGNCHGFTSILNRCNPETQPHTGLLELQNYLALCREGCNFYNAKFAKEYFPKFQEYVLRRLLSVTPNDLKELQDADKSLIDSILFDLDIILKTVLKEFPTAETLERFRVEFARKLLIAPYLNLRIRGVSVLSDVLIMTLRKDSRRNSASSYYYYNNNNPKNQDPCTSWMTSIWYCEWLISGDTMLVLLGDIEVLKTYGLEENHVEILKRLEDILCILAERNLMTQQFIELLWKGVSISSTSSTTSSSTSTSTSNPLLDIQTRTIFKLLSSLSNKLNNDLLPSLYQKLGTLAFPYENIHIDLIRIITENAINNNASIENIEEGLDLLWRIFIKSDSHPIMSGITDYTSQAIATIVGKTQNKKIISQYLANIVQIISDSIHCTSFIRLLQYIIEGIDDLRIVNKPMITKEDAISYCNTELNLLPALLHNLELYLTIKSTAPPPPTTTPTLSPAPNEDTNNNNDSIFERGIEVRFQFLRFIFEYSNAELTFHDIKLIWTLCSPPPPPSTTTTSTTTNNINKIFMSWLCSIYPEERPSGSPRRLHILPCLTDDAAKKIFFELFYGLNDTVGIIPERLIMDGYICVERAFRYVNGANGNLTNSVNKIYFTVESTDLSGCDLLMKIYLVSMEDVAKLCSDFIISLQTRLSGRINKRDSWRAFITQCMEHLSVLLNTQKKTNDENTNENLKNLKMIRLLILLLKFLEEIKKSVAINISQSNSKFEEHKMNVFWSFEPLPTNNNTTPNTLIQPLHKNIMYSFKRGATTLGGLRTRIAMDLKQPANKIRIINGSKSKIPVSQDHKLLVELNIQTYVDVIILREPQEDTIGYTPQPYAKTLEEDPDSDQMYPRKILSENKEFLAVLFQCLSSSQREISESSWKLLEALPTNKDTKNAIVTLDNIRNKRSYGSDTPPIPYNTNNGNDPSPVTVNWYKILDGSSVLSLLYNLRIVDEIVTAATVSYSMFIDHHEAEQWCTDFVAYGGVHHLIQLFLQMDFEQSNLSRLHKHCLSLLLHLLSYFTKEDNPNEIDDSKLVDQTDNDNEVARMTESDKEIPIVEAVEMSDDELLDGRNVITAELYDINEHDVTPTTATANIPSTVPNSRNSITSNNSNNNGLPNGGGGHTISIEALINGNEMAAVEIARKLLIVMHISSTCTVANNNCLTNNTTTINGLPTTTTTTTTLIPTTTSTTAVVTRVDSEKVKAKRKKSRLARFESYYRPSSSATNMSSAANAAVNSLHNEDDDDPTATNNTLSTEAEIVSHTITLLVTLTQHQPDLISVIVEFPELTSSLIQSLLKAPESSLRLAVSRGISHMCQRLRERSGNATATHSFLSILIPQLQETFSCPLTCSEYFSLLINLFSIDNVIENIDTHYLIDTISNYIINKPIFETNEDECDYQLNGLLSLLKLLLSKLSIKSQKQIKDELQTNKKLVHYLFYDCLFAVPSREWKSGPTPPKCKHIQSRHIAFLLLHELCQYCLSNYLLVLQLVSTHHRIGNDVSNESTATTKMKNKRDEDGNKILKNPSAMPATNPTNMLIAKSKTGYVGLNNPGCICYMNSTLQQFYMIPKFRQGILDFHVEVDEGGVSDPNQILMFQLQLMFANLQESEKPFYDPRGFCASFKDFEGEAVDVLVQQDASEFLTNFFQQIEGCVMGSAQENLLKETFGGQFSNELIADGDHYSERPEPFYFISVGFGSSHQSCTLQEALANFIEGETVDYSWERVENGIVVKEALPTLKRVSITTLPQHLIIHLKRFEFDFETMQQLKLNSRFEFPIELNMYPYTKQGRSASNSTPNSEGQNTNKEVDEGEKEEEMDQSSYCYSLAGVVVHLGTAHSGHYYSYIKERGSFEDAWYEFNDAYVTDFDIEELEEETFGGEETLLHTYNNAQNSLGYGSQGSLSSTGGSMTNLNGGGYPTQNITIKQRTRNAFMIVYDRISTTTMTTTTTKTTENTSSIENTRLNSKSEATTTTSENATISMTTTITKSQHERFHANMNHSLLEAIWKENKEFWRRRLIYDHSYYTFMYSLLILYVPLDIDSNQHHLHSDQQQTYPYGLIKNYDTTILRQEIQEKILSNTIIIAVKFVLGTLLQSKERLLIQQWCQRICSIISKCLPACEWLLGELVIGHTPPHSQPKILKQLLLETDDKDVRIAVSAVICEVLRSYDNYHHNNNNDSNNITDVTSPEYLSSPPVKLIQALMSLGKEAQIHYRRLFTFFKPLVTFCELSAINRTYALTNGYLAFCMSFFLGNESPFPELITGDTLTVDPHININNNKTRLTIDNNNNNGNIPPDLRTLLEVMTILLHSSVLPNRLEQSPLIVPPELPLSNQGQAMLESPVFFYRLIKQIKSPSRKKIVMPLVDSAVYGSKSVSTAAIDTIISYMKKEDGLEMKPGLRAALLLTQLLKYRMTRLYSIMNGIIISLESITVHAFSSFFNVKDSIEEWRVTSLMQKLLIELQANIRYTHASEVTISMLVRILKISSMARSIVRANKNSLRWLESYLANRKIGAYPSGSILQKAKRNNNNSNNNMNGNNNNSGIIISSTRVVGGGSGINGMLTIFRRTLANEPLGDSYDSDDEPCTLIGKRIKVRWAEGKFYNGTVVNYDDSTDLHEVYYDDGDRKFYKMSEKTWELIERPISPSNTSSTTSLGSPRK